MYNFIKRLLDIVISFTALIILSPIFIPIIIILRFSAEGEVFYFQERIGINNSRFQIFKFATMLKNSLNIGTGSITLKNDPRVTKIGYFLRKNDFGNMTLELGVAFDKSDYLNAEQKTTYIRGACSIDQKLKSFSSKLEVDYFYQISEVELHSSLFRFQIVVEFEWLISNGLGIISGLTWDIQDEDSSPSMFFTLSIAKPVDWRF